MGGARAGVAKDDERLRVQVLGGDAAAVHQYIGERQQRVGGRHDAEEEDAVRVQ